MTGITRRFIATTEELAELVDQLRTEPRYALDTEFHRERTYFPHPALVQIAWPTGLVLIDPLSVDLMPLAEVLQGPGLAVLHAAQQDLDVLHRACGCVPAQLFDTQLAAGFLGHSTPSLTNLLLGELGLKVPKADRLTDWLHRPLTEDQMEYAASDVAHLLELQDVLTAKLDTLGRVQWAADECEELRVRPVGPPDPDTAWLRLKDHRTLRGPARAVAKEVAGWRERRAAQLDQPTRFVLADLAILAIAQRPPKTVEELRKVRGLDDRLARGDLGDQLLAAVRAGLAADPASVTLPAGDDLDRHLRPAVTLVSAWLSQLARDRKLDTALLGTRADLVALLRGDADARLAQGWRAEMVGDGIRRLIDGKAALAFDGNGNLVLEPRAGQ